MNRRMQLYEWPAQQVFPAATQFKLYACFVCCSGSKGYCWSTHGKIIQDNQYVFPSPNGGPISPDSVNNMLGRVLERAGIPKVRFHDLRHTFATIALQNGVDIKTVSGISTIIKDSIHTP